MVILDGLIHTGRDAVHKYLVDHEAPVDLSGGVIYHCGPVMLKNKEGKWEVKAAGPTTSIREEPYQGEIIRKFGIRAVIGKGGMGAKTLAALKEHGAVYLNAIGGAAQYYADCIEDVEGVHFLEFGIPEAMWHLRVKTLRPSSRWTPTATASTRMWKKVRWKNWQSLRIRSSSDHPGESIRPERLRKTPRGGGAIPRRPEALPSAAAFSLFGR